MALGQIGERSLPDFGLMYNEDGDVTFVGANAVAWHNNMNAWMTQLVGSGTSASAAQSVAYSVATGSDMLLYPSTAGTSWGTYDLDPLYATQFAMYQQFINALRDRVDGVKLAADYAEAHMVKFIPLLRMNDAHFAAGGTKDNINRHPFTGQYWKEHSGQGGDPDYTQQVRPIPTTEWENHKYLFDYAHAGVRTYRLSVIDEVLDRYKSGANAVPFEGFQLDFVRFQALFSANTLPTVDRAGLITEMVRHVRNKLDAIKAQIPGRTDDLALIVRVPPTLKNCEWAGLDVPRWLSEGLVDIVIPAHIMTLAQDQPLDEFVALTTPINSPRGAKVYGSILSRVPHATYAFSGTAPAPGDYKSDRPTTPELVRGAAINGRAMGAGHFELYNFPVDTPVKAVLNESPEDALTMPRVYAITPGYEQDYFDTYESRKQLATQLYNNRQTMVLYLGEDPAAITNDFDIWLRLGITVTTATGDPSTIRIRLNGDSLGNPSSTSSVAGGGRSGPQQYVQYAVNKALLRQGWNTLTIEPTQATPPTIDKYSLIEVQLGVIPH